MNFDTTCTVETSIGELIFRLLDAHRNASTVGHSINVFPAHPTLPNGMKVRKCTAVVLTLVAKHPEEDIVFSCTWEPPFNIRADAESGEQLDAQAWKCDGTIVIVGTEDYQKLSERLPDCGLSENDYPVNYLPNGIEIVIPRVPSGKELSLHFVIAENPLPEPIDNSAWYAVDIEHGILASNISADLCQTFLNRAPIPGVVFYHNDFVQIVEGTHKGKCGSLVTVLSLEPEPLYIIELDFGGDVEVLQSQINQAT